MGRVKVERVRTTVQFPKDLHAAMRAAAEARYTTVSQLIIDAVRKCLNGNQPPAR